MDFPPHFPNLGHLERYTPKEYVFLEVLVENKEFISQKGHCVQLLHSTRY